MKGMPMDNSKNPYIVGDPVGKRDAFVGRIGLVKSIYHYLLQGERAIVLYGQRRIGKTSLLQHVSAHMEETEDFRSRLLDMHNGYAQSFSTLANRILLDIGTIVGVVLDPIIGEDSETFDEQIESRVNYIESLPVSEMQNAVVLLLDEFDVLNDIPSLSEISQILKFLRRLLESDTPWLRFVFVIGRRQDELSYRIPLLLRSFQQVFVSTFDIEETVELVRLSEGPGGLNWDTQAIEKLQSLTGGHPFFAQMLCFNLWTHLHHETNDPANSISVTTSDVLATVSRVSEGLMSAFEYVWNSLTLSERIVASAIASMGTDAADMDMVEEHLNQEGVQLGWKELRLGPQSLVERDILEKIAERYKFKTELMRNWINKEKPLASTKEEQNRIVPAAESYFSAGQAKVNSGRYTEALVDFRNALREYPRYVKACQAMANILIQQDLPNEAIPPLEELHAWNAPAAKLLLVKAHLAVAKMAQSEDDKLVALEKALAFDPENEIALEQRNGILRKRAKSAYDGGRLSLAISLFKQVGDQEQVSRLSSELSQKTITDRTTEIRNLLEHDDFNTAQDAARLLLAEFPNDATLRNLIDEIEQEKKLHSLYLEGESALLEKHVPETATQLFARIIQVKYNYRDTARYFYWAISGTDPKEPSEQIEKLRQESDLRQQEFDSLSLTLDQTTRALDQSQSSVAENNNEIAALKHTIVEYRERANLHISMWNPLDYVRLLYWIYVEPETFETYTRLQGISQTMKMGRVVVSVLCIVPLAVLLIETFVTNDCRQGMRCQPTILTAILFVIVIGLGTTLIAASFDGRRDVGFFKGFTDQRRISRSPSSADRKTELRIVGPLNLVILILSAAFLLTLLATQGRNNGGVMLTLLAYFAVVGAGGMILSHIQASFFEFRTFLLYLGQMIGIVVAMALIPLGVEYPSPPILLVMLLSSILVYALMRPQSLAVVGRAGRQRALVLTISIAFVCLQLLRSVQALR